MHRLQHAAQSSRATGRRGGTGVQTTIKSPVTFAGVGLHTGASVRVTLHPAAAEFGIWFRRSDVAADGLRDPLIPARWDAVVPSSLCTRLENAAGVSVSTVEHLMAAVAGCGLVNLLVEVEGPEIPILDGSAGPFVAGILARGLRRQHAPVRAFEIRKRIEVRRGDAWAALEPHRGSAMSFEIDFADAAIGRQAKTLDLANGAFVRELCDSRTFCRRVDVETMRAQGLIRGGSYENAVVVEGARVLSPGGLRHPDEAVRHKMLDAVGDLALAGAPILGRYVGHRAGHALTNALLRRLFATPEAAAMVVCGADRADRLPGAALSRHDLAGLPLSPLHGPATTLPPPRAPRVPRILLLGRTSPLHRTFFCGLRSAPCSRRPDRICLQFRDPRAQAESRFRPQQRGIARRRGVCPAGCLC